MWLSHVIWLDSTAELRLMGITLSAKTNRLTLKQIIRNTNSAKYTMLPGTAMNNFCIFCMLIKGKADWSLKYFYLISIIGSENRNSIAALAHCLWVLPLQTTEGGRWGLVPGPPWIPKSMDAQVTYINWSTSCI